VALVAVGALGPLAFSKDDRPSAPVDSAVLSSLALVPGSDAATDPRLEDRVDSGQADSLEHAALAFQYMRQARDEADPSYLPKVESLLERSLGLQPNENFAALMGMAAYGNATHDFSGSVTWARKAIEVNPFNAGPYGLLGDALFELGRYDAADRAYQKMIDTRPEVASYVRASYSAQYHGNNRAALHAMRLAIQAAPRAGEEAAWLRHQLGDIYASMGRVELAGEINREGIRLAPGYVPPTVGVAESFIAKGQLKKALPLIERAASKLPTLEYLGTLGDLRHALGDRAGAVAAYEELKDKLAVYRESGVRPDVDFILIYADHADRLDAALDEARAIYKDRPTAGTADALGWILHAHGRDAEAARYAREAIDRSNAPDALHHFHAGSIALGLGNEDAARRHLKTALDLDPRFSLTQAPEARRLLNSIDG
jgi:tetratricopeptide (TPR) repeat protein